jgi:phosphoribosyl-dephospho-CoA transferase
MASAQPALDVRRHDFVHLSLSCDEFHGSDLSLRDKADVRAWIMARRPFVARRQDAGAVTHNRICLGLPLPPAAGKRRIAIEIDAAQVCAIDAPPRLRECLHAVPAAWCEPLTRLETSSRRLGIVFRVFGSLALQATTGIAYLHPGSDVDLLWAPADRPSLEAGLDLLAAWELSSGMRADGEILFAQQGACWREWRGGTARVLVKGIGGPSLVSRDHLLAALDPGYTPERSAA